MGFFDNNRNKSDYDAAASKIATARGDMSKLNSHERDLVERMSRESSARGNKVRDALK